MSDVKTGTTNIHTVLSNLKTSFITWFDNVVKSVSNVGTIVSDWFKSMTSSLSAWFDNVKSWISTVNTSIWDSVKKVGEWFVELGGKIVEFKDSVLAWFGGFFEALKETFLSIFVPSEDYFENKNNELSEALNSHFEYSELINPFTTFKNMTNSTPENITCELYGQTFTIIDWKYIVNVRPTIYFWVRGFFYPFLLLFNFNQLYKLIRGTSLVGSGRTGGEIGGQMSFDDLKNKWGG